MGTKEWYSKMVLKFLQEHNKRYFKARQIAQQIGLNSFEVREGLKVLKANGIVQKFGSVTWEFQPQKIK